MKLRSLTLLALLGGLSFAAACSDDTPTEPVDGANKLDTSVVFPLTIGNEWVYKTIYINTSGIRDTVTKAVTAYLDTMMQGRMADGTIQSRVYTLVGDSTRPRR